MAPAAVEKLMCNETGEGLKRMSQKQVFREALQNPQSYRCIPVDKTAH